MSGPYPTDKRRNRWFVLFVDRFTRFKYVGLMKAKSDTYDHFLAFCESATRQHPDVSLNDVVSIRMDGGAKGGEFSRIRYFLTTTELGSYPMVGVTPMVTLLQKLV